VQCVVTSPPYWGLRDYGLPPTVWGGEDPGCAHAWGEETVRVVSPQSDHGPDGGFGTTRGTEAWRRGASLTASQGTFCARCGAWRGALGLEPTPEAYVAHLVEVFRAVRRVLREDGTCWVNLGDSYSSIGWRPGGAIGVARGVPYVRGDYVVRRGSPSSNWRTAPYGGSGKCGDSATTRPTELGDDPYRLKVKDLVGIPWRVAFALQADGWYLRSEIIWAKPNPMPESVTDRPTKAHEQLFLLAKAERYFFDAEAIKEPASMDSGFTKQRLNGTANWSKATQSDTGRASFVRVTGNEGEGRLWQDTGARSKRSVWTIPSAPFSEAHFATFPPALVEPCVQAGTSEKGACPACGAPWRRVTAIQFVKLADRRSTRKALRIGADMADINSRDAMGYNDVTTLGWAPTCACAVGLAPGVVEPCVQAGTSERGCCAQCGAPWRREFETDPAYHEWAKTQRFYGPGGLGSAFRLAKTNSRQAPPKGHTTGWAPTCACAPDPKPCVVLDPFAGAGTVGLVADRLGRDAILIELKPEYAAMAERRIREEAPLLAAVAVEGETVEPPPVEPGGKALTTPRGAEGARWNQNQGRGFARPDGQPWGRAAPAAPDPGPAAPEQLALDWAEIARVDV
jgi:DNA modification methylase